MLAKLWVRTPVREREREKERKMMVALKQGILKGEVSLYC
jgi:hypothetical protein